MRYLEGKTSFLKEIQARVNKWHAKEMQEVQQKARRAAAGEARVDSGDGHACDPIAWGSGVVATGLFFAPETGGASFVVGIFSAATGLGGLTGSC